MSALRATAPETAERQEHAHRVLTVELDDPAKTTAARAQISSALRWRDAYDARQLVVNMLVRDANGLAGVKRIVQHVDAMAVQHRDRPMLRVYCLLPESIARLVGQLADVDARTPRIEVIRVVDHPLEPKRLAQLMCEAASAESALLLFWVYFELSATRELAELADLLHSRALGMPDQLSLRRFPIAEIPGTFIMNDAEPIAEFWSQHPPVQEASIRSLHGRVQTFFRYFELARLERLGLELPPLSNGVGSDDYRLLPEFCAWLDGSRLLATEPQVATAVLEHDVDLLADSHECQSPVFAFAGLPRYVNAGRPTGSAP